MTKGKKRGKDISAKPRISVDSSAGSMSTRGKETTQSKRAKVMVNNKISKDRINDHDRANIFATYAAALTEADSRRNLTHAEKKNLPKLATQQYCMQQLHETNNRTFWTFAPLF